MITNLPNIISPLFCNYINLENLNYERLLHNFNIDDFSSLSELIGHMQHSQCINNPVGHVKDQPFSFFGGGTVFSTTKFHAKQISDVLRYEKLVLFLHILQTNKILLKTAGLDYLFVYEIFFL